MFACAASAAPVSCIEDSITANEVGHRVATRFSQLRFLVQSYRTAKNFLNDLVPILKLKLRAIEIQDEKANG